MEFPALKRVAIDNLVGTIDLERVQTTVELSDRFAVFNIRTKKIAGALQLETNLVDDEENLNSAEKYSTTDLSSSEKEVLSALSSDNKETAIFLANKCSNNCKNHSDQAVKNPKMERVNEPS